MIHTGLRIVQVDSQPLFSPLKFKEHLKKKIIRCGKLTEAIIIKINESVLLVCSNHA